MSKARLISCPVDILVSLFVLPVFMAASARTATALLIVVALFFVFMLASFFSVLLSPRVPSPLKGLVDVLLAFLFAWLANILLGLLFPIYSIVFEFSLALVPVAWLGADKSRFSYSRDPLSALADAALEALSLGLLILVGAAIREFAGSFALSVPAEGGARYLFSQESVQAYAPGGIAGAASAFALFIALRLVYPLCRGRIRAAGSAGSARPQEASRQSQGSLKAPSVPPSPSASDIRPSQDMQTPEAAPSQPQPQPQVEITQVQTADTAVPSSHTGVPLETLTPDANSPQMAEGLSDAGRPEDRETPDA